MNNQAGSCKAYERYGASVIPPTCPHKKVQRPSRHPIHEPVVKHAAGACLEKTSSMHGKHDISIRLLEARHLIHVQYDIYIEKKM